MFERRTVSRALFGIALTGSLLSTFIATGPASAAGGQPQATATTPSRQVTLITGDRVGLADDGQVTVQYNAQRRDISFVTYKQQGDVFAIPSDAIQLVWSGQLDRQLFDVTQLLAYGYNTQSGSMPVILSYADGSQSSVRAAVTAGGARVTHDLSSVRSLSVRSAHPTATAFWNGITQRTLHGVGLRHGVTKVWLDAVYHPVDEVSTPQVGAPTAWAAGFDGTGQTVAVVDSGIDTTHPDLAGKVTAAANFTSESDTRDMLGHGTHVASIIAGTGAASGGAQKGVAPGAKLLNSKVCKGDNQCAESDIIAGMQWAVQQGAKVINMSLGAPDGPGIDPIEQAVNDLTASSGALFVVAAGNNGPSFGTLGSPGSADAALTVGAVDRADNLASFSSRGPRGDDGALKPDVTAPGVSITGARSSTGTFGNPGDTYVQLSGTSMATPHVAGAVALIRASHPTWTAAQLKAAVMGSADPNPSADTFAQGAGRLDVGRGYAQNVLADPPSLSLDRQPAPHSDDPVQTRTITYHNNGGTAVTLTLSITSHDPTGASAPAGMFSLGASSLTVPAGGQASVTLTADTRSVTTDGHYTGTVTASSANTVVQTPFGVDAVAAANTLTLNVVGRSGGAPAAWNTLVFKSDGTQVYGTGGGGTSGSIDLPAATYLVWTTIWEVDAQGQPRTTIMVKQRLDLTGAQTLTFDARTAGQVNVSVPDVAAQQYSVEIGGELSKIGPGGISTTSFIQSGTVYTGQVDGPNSFVYGFDSKVVVQSADPGSGGDLRNSPHSYSTGYFTDQQLPTGLTRSLSASDFATVVADHGGQYAGTVGYKGSEPEASQYGFGSAIIETLPMDLPHTRTESYNTEAGVRWYGFFEEQDSTGNAIDQLVSNLQSYTAGTSTQDMWNHPVFGPAFTSTVQPIDWVVRSGDIIYADVPLFGDSAGHAGHAGPAVTASGQITLKRNGTVLGTSPYPSIAVPTFRVPSDFGSYELDATLQRTSAVALSTSVSAAWTFTSATVDPNSVLRLQMWAVTFKPALDANNAAPAGTSFAIPLTVAPQPGAATSSVKTVTVDYSTDDGATWSSATVSGTNGAYTATVTHPSATGYVSLRAHAEDWAGNTVTETVTRAYRIA